MSLMTWGELKQHIEKKGIKDNTPISYIDISYPTTEFPPEVQLPNPEAGIDDFVVIDGGL